MLDGTTYISVRETQNATPAAFRAASPEEIQALVRQAQQMRAAAIGAAIANAIVSVTARVQAWRNHSATMLELQRLDDRMLADIGVTRDQIAAIAEGGADNVRPGALSSLVEDKIVAPLRRWRMRVRTQRELGALDDAMLRDIGIERGQIDGIAIAAAEGKISRPGATVAVGRALGLLDLPMPANSNTARPHGPVIVDAAD